VEKTEKKWRTSQQAKKMKRTKLNIKIMYKGGIYGGVR
jgi:hypothetical protein